MKKVWLVCAVLFTAGGVYAQIDGPYSGTTFSVVAIPGSSNSWINTGNAGNSDNLYSSFGNLPGAAGSFTDYLVITNFLFAIPPGAAISGIVVEMERSDLQRRTSDYSIRILKNGVIGAAERASAAGYRAGDSYQSYGSAGDLWGETWTVAEINDPGFGVAISAQRSVNGGITAGKIDDVQITIFYNFVITPVNLLSFSAEKKDKNAEIDWTTSSEVSMDYYDIERSSDGNDFTSIGTVKSKNQSSSLDYAFIDKNPLNGVSYYRLKMVGVAGDIRYSKIVSIRFDTGNSIFVYPNPIHAGENLYISNSSREQLEIKFYTISGQQVADIRTNSNLVPTQNFKFHNELILYKVFQKNGNLKATGKLVVM